MNPLCLVKAKKPRPYNPDSDYSSITDQYPEWSLYRNLDTNEVYNFSWYDSDTCMSDSYDWGHSVSVYGDTYMTDCYEYDDESIPCPIGPLCPPLQGPPPSSQVHWSFPGYPVFYNGQLCEDTIF